MEEGDDFNENRCAEEIAQKNGFYQFRLVYTPDDLEYAEYKALYDVGCPGMELFETGETYEFVYGTVTMTHDMLYVYSDVFFPGNRYYATTGFGGGNFGMYQGKNVRILYISEEDLTENKSWYYPPEDWVYESVAKAKALLNIP